MIPVVTPVQRIRTVRHKVMFKIICMIRDAVSSKIDIADVDIATAIRRRPGPDKGIKRCLC